MAYQFVDTFDHYNTAFLTALGMYEAINGSPVISTAYARFPAIGSFPNQGCSLPSNTFLRKNLKSNQGTLIAFLSFGAIFMPLSGYTNVISFLDNGTYQVVLGVSASGALQFLNPAGTPIGPSSAIGLIAPSAMPNHGIEIKVVISNTAGSVQCWLDGSLVINSSASLDTQLSANAYANQVQLGAAGTGSSLFYTDYLRVWDNTGSYQNAPVGFDCRKLTKLDASAGFYTQWTANGAGTNYGCCNEASPDGDTTYVSSAGLNFDSYGMGTSGLAGVPSMVAVKSYARKDDGATRTLQIGVRSGTSNGLLTAAMMGSTYAWVDGCISEDPANPGHAPTAAAADAYQFLKFEAM
jgi:hypothetical protein